MPSKDLANWRCAEASLQLVRGEDEKGVLRPQVFKTRLSAN
jgi:hypothetical protein